MALVVAGSLSVNTASTVLTFLDTTGNYNVTTNPTGFGAPNRAIANNIGTDFVFTLPDLSSVTVTVDGTTLPTTNFVVLNSLTRDFTLSQLSLTSTVLPTGGILLTYRPFFVTPSGGNVGVTLASPTVTRQSAQDFTVDFADSDTIMLAGVKYTILSKTTSTITLTENYAGATNIALATCYIGYEANIAVLTPYEFLVCLNSQWADLRWDGCHCNDPKYSSLNNLRNLYQQVNAKMADADYIGSNLEMIDLAALCTCVEEGGGRSCGCG